MRINVKRRLMRQLKITERITRRDDESLERYMQDVSKEEMISHHEEADLSKRIKQGDKEALNKLVRANLRFVISVAKQYQNQGLPLQDLITEGNIGLIKAAQRFDETKGFKFISYAVWWIRQSIVQAITEHARIVRLPLNKISNISKVNKMMAKLEQDNERELDIHQIAEETGLSIEDVNNAILFSTRAVSLDASIPNSDNSDTTLLDLLCVSETNNVDKPLEYESLQKDLNRLLQTLPKREIEIINNIYGLNGMQPISLDEVAKKLNITKERVRQIRDKIITKLRYSQKSKLLKMYIA